MNITPAQWEEEARIAYYETGANYDSELSQADWQAQWLAKRGRDEDGNILTTPPPADVYPEVYEPKDL
jgi:hypothetical protein